MKSLKIVTISKDAVKRGRNSDISLPSFDFESISQEQEEVIIDILLNEYYKTEKGE